jgi:tetrapyrrole methylase family protein / MazG family protein
MTITVVGLGPSGPDEVTVGTMRAIAAHQHRFVRTQRHPSASVVEHARSFDEFYELHDSFDEVYAAIIEALVEADRVHGHIVYAVPGSPLVAEHTVERLLADDRVDVVVVAAMSFLDLTWARLKVDPQRGGVRLVDGMNFAAEIVGERGPVLVSQCHSQQVLSDIKCSLSQPPSTVTVLQRLGLDDEQIFTIDWDDLDRIVVADHLTSLWIPELVSPLRHEMQRLVDTMQTLRLNCPWDQEQTHVSLAPYAIEESYELAEAIRADASPDASDTDTDHFVDELGDVLFQVVFHSCLGEEEARFALEDVTRSLTDKLIRRHPHVFGGSELTTSDAVLAQWEVLKKSEREGDGSVEIDPMAGLTEGLPSLTYAGKVLKRAVAASYVDVPSGKDLFADDQCTNDQMGAYLLEVIAACRRLKIDPETALRLAAANLRDSVRAEK